MNKSSRLLKAVTIDGKRVFTTKGEKAVTDRLELCAGCARSRAFERFAQCPILEKMNGFKTSVGIGLSITYCAIHEPVLGFQPPLIGFDGGFNTMRPGKAWCERLRRDDVVGLLDVKSGELIGKAAVESVESGDIHSMLEKHAANNHLMLGRDCNYQVELRTILRRIYGPAIITDNSTITAINLRRIA